ncbi:MAG: tRNA-uridine aminocarboxypropyltransferase [Pseudomonadota bacterium]
MNLAEYKNKKKLRLRQSTHNLEALRNLCIKCLRPDNTCICKNIIPFQTKAHIKILIHPKELKRVRITTGRLAHLCLENSSTLVGAEFQTNTKVNEILDSNEVYPLLLYPGPEVHNISEAPIHESIINKRKLVIFVIDGTWRWAKQILKNSKNLQGIDRISFDSPGLSKFTIKRQPAEFCLSTIESIYHLLDAFDRWEMEDFKGKHNILIKTLEAIVAIQMKYISKQNKSRHRINLENKVKKIQHRKQKSLGKICFDKINYPN